MADEPEQMKQRAAAEKIRRNATRAAEARLDARLRFIVQFFPVELLSLRETPGYDPIIVVTYRNLPKVQQ